MSHGYEVHITCLTSQAEDASDVAVELGWKTSQIARDAVLGSDTFYYLTTHAPSFEEAVSEMLTASEHLKAHRVHVLREKIEHILYDRRY